MVREIGNKAAMAAIAAVLGFAFFSSGIARSDDKAKEPVTAKQAFAKLKTLKGNYHNKAESTEHQMPGDHSKVTYRLTGAGRLRWSRPTFPARITRWSRFIIWMVTTFE